MNSFGLQLRTFLATICKKLFSIVFWLIFGKGWLAKHRYYRQFELFHHFFGIWFTGLMVRRIRKLVQIKLPEGIALQLFETDAESVIRDVYFEKVYDRFYRLQNDDIVIDIGSHVGLFALKVSRRAELVIAVEPHPLNYKLLVTNITINNLQGKVIPINLALSNYSGKGKLYLRSSATHSLKTKLGKALEVQVETLDRLVDALKLNKVTFIKMDVEGAELHVLEGSEKVLTMNDRLFLAIAAYHYPGEALEIAKYLQAKGFKVFSNGRYVYAFKPYICSRTLLKC